MRRADRHDTMAARWRVALLAGWLAAGAAPAQTPLPAAPAVQPEQARQDAGAKDPRSVCVEAEVDGVRALSYDCLSRQLQPPAAPAAGASQPASSQLATQPSNRVGTFNLSAERNRFGNTWGKSVTPQRPGVPIVVPPR
ncbi:hypothetical protein [Burkholderia plantarii]|uniref:hypothetical protein n=1 Tax=Burkholderia plantarii TaxID=41899 RepID=UPI000705B4DC|nr:hypothetical protein [Burkholderia plantarii]ALK34204.1 hypothetical protein bpln_2g19900 [Burkholderia plantarii]GLZ20669.1 hypothetical protein Bpla01_41980 [Burkholderia plantarii]